ncbi:hypothetical protein SAMN05443245_3396 [Paraburkholderia fungorum]|uniref:ASCH domain-containing protein n=1 Tax=Paraburkholderia fungorum TaxID=134537 RepID=A0A1H1H061_9BURK|nr:hypothetical protein [Paraburkholderia fungorum]SDR18476.1 hypothetical protein SAMN05443245_3396 [Paraburkholderia fungorum]
MQERPILFSGPMVRALLDGSKTQTRRIVAQQPTNGWAFETPPAFGRITSPHPKKDRFGAFIRRGIGTDFPQVDLIPSPFGMPGDRLWVRETWRGVVAITPPGESTELAVARYVPDQQHCRRVEFQATQPRDSEPWRPSIHMPRWASRITLEVTDVRVERLNEISDTDAAAEGWPGFTDDNSLDSMAWFSELWDSLAPPVTDWQANPWVWVVEFKRVT